jgi:hypothetical protein
MAAVIMSTFLATAAKSLSLEQEYWMAFNGYLATAATSLSLVTTTWLSLSVQEKGKRRTLETLR